MQKLLDTHNLKISNAKTNQEETRRTKRELFIKLINLF